MNCAVSSASRCSRATDLRIYDDALRAYAVDPGAYEVEVGASSADIRLSGRFAVDSR